MKLLKILHIISHLKWLFTAYMVGLLIYIYLNPENQVQLVGTAILLGGVVMGFGSLSDIKRMSKKEIKELSNPKFVKRQLIVLFGGVVFLVFISLLFLFLRYIFPDGQLDLIKSFSKLGYDCLVMMLGMFCLIKQFQEKVDYVNELKAKE